jgi:gluconate 2-dehydrogenase gamma chain
MSAFFNLPRPRACSAAEESKTRAVLSAGQWTLVDAIAARIIPSDDSPGAREAGCVNFIDKALAHEDSSLRATYEQGLAALENLARSRFDKPFAGLAASEQDTLLVSLQDGVAAEWSGKDIGQQQFFETVRMHTIIGFLADPVHGGNRGYAGWKHTGYPGPAHHRGGFTPAQLIGAERVVAVWDDE